MLIKSKKYKIKILKELYDVIEEKNNKIYLNDLSYKNIYDLAYVLTEIGYIYYLDEVLKEKKVARKVMEKIFYKELCYGNNIRNYANITYVILNEYVKNNDILNVDVFIKFNLSKLKQEIMLIVDNLIENYMIENEKEYIDNFDDDNIYYNDVNYSEFDVFIKKDENNSYNLYDVDNNVIDKEYIKNKLNIVLQIDDKQEQDNMVLMLIYIVVLIEYFSKIRIYLDKIISYEDEQIIKRILEISTHKRNYEFIRKEDNE